MQPTTTEDLRFPKVSVDEVASKLGVHPNTVRAVMKAGKLRNVKMGKYRRTTWTWVEAYIAANTTGGEPGAPAS